MTSFRFNLSDGTSYDLIYACYGAVSYTHLDVYKRQLGDTVKPRLMEAEADLERVLVMDDRDTPLTRADERIARAIRENNARLVIIDPVQAFLGADVDMNRANEVRPIFRSLGDIAQATGAHFEAI